MIILVIFYICLYLSGSLRLGSLPTVIFSKGLTTNMQSFNASNPLHRILIFQYGKVASTAMRDAFVNLGVPTVYISTPTKHYARGVHTHSADVASDMLLKMSSKSQIWIVTIIRNRFVRDISAYFENLLSFNVYRKHLPISSLHKDFRQRIHGPNYTDDFFSDAFRKVTKLNMLEHADVLTSSSSNHIAVHHLRENKQLNILLLRFEDAEHWENTIFNRYFPGLVLKKKNVGQKKWYASMYKDFLKTYVPNEQEIKMICNGETLQFYSSEEKEVIAPQCFATSPGSSSIWTGLKFGAQFVTRQRVHVRVTNFSLLMHDLSGLY